MSTFMVLRCLDGGIDLILANALNGSEVLAFVVDDLMRSGAMQEEPKSERREIFEITCELHGLINPVDCEFSAFGQTYRIMANDPPAS